MWPTEATISAIVSVLASLLEMYAAVVRCQILHVTLYCNKIRSTTVTLALGNYRMNHICENFEWWCGAAGRRTFTAGYATHNEAFWLSIFRFSWLVCTVHTPEIVVVNFQINGWIKLFDWLINSRYIHKSIWWIWADAMPMISIQRVRDGKRHDPVLVLAPWAMFGKPDGSKLPSAKSAWWKKQNVVGTIWTILDTQWHQS